MTATAALIPSTLGQSTRPWCSPPETYGGVVLSPITNGDEGYEGKCRDPNARIFVWNTAICIEGVGVVPRRMMCVTGVYVCVCPLPLEGVASSRGAARLETSHALTVTILTRPFCCVFRFQFAFRKSFLLKC